MHSTSRAPSGRRAGAALRGRAWPRAFPFIALLFVLIACVLALPVRAQQQPLPADVDPPGRVARLNLADGPLSFAAAGSEQWTAAPYNRPLTDGDRLWTAQGSRAEIDTGGGLLWLDGATSLTFSAVDDELVQLQLTQGALALRLADLQQGDRFEIDTPNLAFVADRGGDYRVDVDVARGLTQVTVLAGSALVYGERGESTDLRAGQRLAFSGRQLTPVAAVAAVGSDRFDQWVAARDRALEQSTSARYVAPGTVGYQQLDQYGSWQTSSEYGSVWYPTSVPANWAPYRYGQWSYIAPWGWTWVDDAPWGFAPFHYGRWVQSGSRWGWAPGSSGRRATYAPALVAFGGVGGGDVHWRPGHSSSSWFPLAPGEAWRPGYHASDRYIDRVNHGILERGGRFAAPDRYIYAGQPGAITSVDRTDWQPRRPVRGVPIGTGFDAPARAPFVQPALPLPKPWAVTEQRPQQPRDPLRVQEAVAPPEWGSRRGRGDVFVAPPAVAPIRNAQPIPKPYAVEVEQRPLAGERLIHQPRQQQQQTAQFPMRQQEQQFEQQQRLQQLQQQQSQQHQQQQRYQFEQQQRVQADQQRRAQADQWQQRQQQMQQQQFQQQQQQQQQQQNQRFQQQQNSMREQQLQQQVLRDHQLYERQQQQSQSIRNQQNRGPQP